MSGSSLLGIAMWCRAAITDACTSAIVGSLSRSYDDSSLTPKFVTRDRRVVAERTRGVLAVVVAAQRAGDHEGDGSRVEGQRSAHREPPRVAERLLDVPVGQRGQHEHHGHAQRRAPEAQGADPALGDDQHRPVPQVQRVRPVPHHPHRAHAQRPDRERLGLVPAGAGQQHQRRADHRDRGGPARERRRVAVQHARDARSAPVRPGRPAPARATASAAADGDGDQRGQRAQRPAPRPAPASRSTPPAGPTPC